MSPTAVPGDARTPRRADARWVPWVAWFAGLIVVTLLLLLVRARLDKAHVALVFLLVVLGGSAGGGRGLGISLAVAAFLSFNFFFLRPYLTLVVADPLDWLVLAAFLITSVVAAQLLFRATSTTEAAMQRAAEVDRLATLGAETLNLTRPEDALRAILGVIRATLGVTAVTACEVFVQESGGGFVLAARSPGDAPEGRDASHAALGAARAVVSPSAPPPASTDATDAAGLVGWIFRYDRGAVELADGTVRIVDDPAQEAARASRDNELRSLSIPLLVRGETVGVLRVFASRDLVLTYEQARFLDALAYYAALGVERGRLVAEAERAESERRLEALRAALLTAVSHDLRTPLTTIKAIAHEIVEGGPRERARIIEDESDRLDSLVGDLLDLSRIQSGAVHAALEVNTADDLIGAALQRAEVLLRPRRVDIEVPDDDLLTGRFDLTNALRAFVNLIENACRYSPPTSPITIRAERADGRLRISVLDRGPGVPLEEQDRIFEPFYRPRGTAPDVRGTGLGLSIARGLAMAQGGAVEFEPRQGGGSVFSLLLPAADGGMPFELEAEADALFDA